MNLFSRQVLLLVVTAVTPLVLLGLAVVDQNRAALTRDANAYLQVTAERGRDLVQGELDQLRAQLDAVALTISAPDLGADDARLAAVKALVSTSPQLQALVLFDAAGGRRWTLKTKGELAVKAPETVTPVTEPGLTLLSHEQLGAAPLLWVAVPVGERLGTLAALVSLEGLTAPLGALGDRPPLANRSAVFVTDVKGTPVLAGGGEPRAALFLERLGQNLPFRQAVSLSVEYRDAQGKELLGAFATVPELGWAVVVDWPREQAYATLAETRRAVGVAVGAAVLAALLVGLWGARRLTRPLQALEDDTKRLAAGTFERVDPAVAARPDELGRLARSFDGMWAELKAAQRRVLEEAERKNALARYLAPEVVDQALKDPAALTLGGARREVVVLFADVVGFTKLSEALPPETVVALLNELFTVETEVIHRHKGMVDKFIGDAVMAVWGLPEASPQDVERALECAQQLREWVEAAQRKWREKYGLTVHLAIGLHVGEAIAGNIGSPKRLEYTVIGDTVNVAARLEAQAVAGQIVISGELADRAKDCGAELKPIKEETLRGRSTVTRILEVL